MSILTEYIFNLYSPPLFQGKIDKKVEQFLERIIDAEHHTVVKAYENQVRKLEEKKILVSENIAQCGRPLPDFDMTFRTALDFLGNPYKLWCSDRMENKRIVLKLTFADKLTYDRNEGFRTAAISQPFLLLEELKESNSELVEVRSKCSNRILELLASWNTTIKRAP